ncbi:MAG: hypothetical protein K2X48_02210 [Chitinophagaceae bacterium]|nr:hypothetical protein [Chitinophagaceae bacterium]
MITEKPKNSSHRNERPTLKKRTLKKKITVDDFFGKLPSIEDGLKFQKKVRGEWK